MSEHGRRPALEVFQETFLELDPEDQELVRRGLHVGRVINEYQETFARGDFLVRNVLGADDEGAIAITDRVRVGQTVQLQVRDAASAHDDLIEVQGIRPSEPLLVRRAWLTDRLGTTLEQKRGRTAEAVKAWKTALERAAATSDRRRIERKLGPADR